MDDILDRVIDLYNTHAHFFWLLELIFKLLVVDESPIRILKKSMEGLFFILENRIVFLKIAIALFHK